MAESTSTLQEKLKALTHGKVDIMLDADTFKSTTQILREMSAVWEEMTDIEQAAALELMGGKRQSNILASLISNFETVEDVIETSMNSSGSAMAENAKWMDSIAGKSEQLSNNMQAMWENTLNSDVIKLFYDIAIGATDLVKNMGLLPPVLAGVLIYFKAFKNIGPISLGKDFAASVKNYAGVMQQVSQIKSLNLGMTSTGMLGVQSVKAYAQALSGMSAQQQAAILTSAGLEKAHIAQVLAQNGVKDATIRQIVGLNNLNAAKQASVAMTGAEVQATLAKQGVTLSDATTTWLADNATKELTRDEILKAAATLMSKSATEQEIVALLGLAGASGTASLGIKGVTAALWTMMKSNPLGWIMMLISGITMLVSKIKQSKEEAIKAAEQTVSAYKEAQNTLKEQKKTIDELSVSYERLSKGVDLDTNENISLTSESYKEYLNICNDIADMYPNLVTSYDAQGNAILSLKGNVDELIQAYNDAAQAARQKMIAGGGELWKTFKDTYDVDPSTTFEKTGLVQQVKLAEKLQELINDASDDEIIKFFDKLQNGEGIEIDGNKYTNLELMDTLKSMGIGTNWLNMAEWQSTWTGNMDVEKFKQTSAKINSFIKANTTQINTETSKVKSLMDAYLGEDFDYAQLSNKSRALIDQIVHGFDAEFINSFDSADSLYNWIKTNVIDAFKDSSVTDAISELSKLQFEFDKGDISYSDYTKQLNDYISQIQNKVDGKALAQIKVGIGIDEASLQTSVNHALDLLGGDDRRGFRLSKLWSLPVEDLQIAGQLEVPEGTILSWEELIDEIEKAKIAATKDFDITNFTDAISAHSASISEYQEALQKLEKGSFTMDDFMELIKKYPELAKGVDVSSNAFHGLSRNLKGAVKTSTKNFTKDLKELRASLVAAGKSTDSIDQLIEAIENMPEDALDGTIQKYSTLADKIDSARRAQDKLSASMGENPNEGYETRGEAMEYMKEAMKRGEIGSESNLWNVAEKYGFTYDSAKTINENADALATFIATRERWFKTADDGDDRTNDEYSYEGTENFIKDVESAVANSAELQQYLTWDYDETTGTLNFDYNNEDWDTIVSILSKTKELAGLTSDEFSDMMIQIGQYFGIDWGNYDDILGHLNKIATGTSDAKTKVEEYGKSMQDYFGENSDVDLTTRPMVKFDSTNFKEWEKLYKEIINNPDGHSEADVKNAEEQLASIQRGDSYATVYSSTFSNEDGTKSVVVTPILPDGKVLSPEQLEEYANKLLAGEELEPGVDIKLAEFDGSNSVQKANEYAIALHKAQEEYDRLRDTLKINTTIDEKGLSGLTEIKEIQSAINTKADGTVVIDEEAFREALTSAQYTEDQIDVIIEKIKKLNKEAFNIDPFKIDETLTDKGVAGLEEIEKVRDSLTKDESTGLTIFDTDMFTSVLQEAGYTEDKIKSLIDRIKEYNGIVSVSGNTDPLGLNNANLSVDSLKASLSSLGIAYKDTLGTWGDGKRDLTINVKDLVTTLKEKGWTDASIKEYVTKLSSNTSLEGFNVKVNGIENIDEVIKTANEVPEEETTEYTVTGTGLSTVKTINDELSKIPATKSTAYTITETTVKETKDKTKFNLFDPSTWANGTANAQGTAFADGNWGAPRTETALVGELGPELLVRGNRWTTVGDDGAEFTQVKKGDIIFNHKQTESLLRNGYVTSRGKAYASGTAYAQTEDDATFARYKFSGSGGWRQYNVNDVVVESWGDLSGAIDDATDSLESASDAADEFEETFDWVEVRLEEINEQLDLMDAQLENAGNYASKNNIIDQIMGVNTNKMANLMAGIQKYSDYAAKLLTDVPAQYREAAQNGAIAITEFVGEADEKTVEAIEKYREWAQKVADLKQELEGVKTELRELAIQKIDNAEHSGAVRADVEDSQTEKLQNAVDFDEESGLITSPAYYTAMMENSSKTIEYLTKARNEMQKEFNDAVKSGLLVKGSDEWYENLDKLYQIDAEIDEANIELEEFQNKINDIYWDNFDQLINRLDYVKEDTQNLIDLMDSDDMVITPETDDGWSADQVEWTKEGMASMGLYAQQMEIAEYEARQYAKAIDDLSADYEAGKYSENEYLEKLNELKKGQYENIEAYYDAQNAIVELNEARVDAIKEGIEKEIDAYEELINKKKEELSVEKDLYDFQKGVADQQKNIADIQRKLAALSADSSASAVAKRKQLEAELAEANAELEETYYERSIENQQNALDKELEDFTEEKDAELKKWDEYLTNIEQVVADSLGIVQTNATEIGKTLTDKAEEYNLTVSSAVLSPWQDGALAISNYQTAFDTATSSTTTKLDGIKTQWQDVINKMTEAGQLGVDDINAENASYAAATKAPEPKPNNNNTNTNANKEKAIVVGGKINASGAKIYSNVGGAGYSQYFRSDPIYTVLSEQGGWLKVRHHKASSGITGWFKKSDVKAYAKGTLGVDKDQWALIDELGEELVMHADGSGKLSFMTKGTTVIPHDITENLMGLGQLDPSDILNRNRPQITPSKSVINNNMEIHVDASVGELIHVDRLDGNNLDEITKIVDKAWNKNMQNLNNSIKKFVR